MLQWAHVMAAHGTSTHCAAEGGYLAVLQWAHAHGCLRDESTRTCAACVGYLAVLQWAHAHGCPWDKLTCAYAAEGGHLAVPAVGAPPRLPMGQVDARVRG